jgi:hypothetical protein
VRVCAATFLSAVALSGCLGYVPGEKAYWDGEVDALCKKDGGLRVFQKPHLSQEERAILRSKNGKISIPIKDLAPANAPIYGVLTQTYIKEGNPSVSRSQADYVRRTDGAIIATSVTYTRAGGDFPSHAYPSSYSCPDRRQHLLDRDELDKLFAVD